MPAGAFRRRVAGIAFKGDRFECPCCGGRFAWLLRYGAPPRPNARCPRCGSLERHRAIWLYLRDQTDLLGAPHRVLDVAPEPFLQRILRARPEIDYISIDLESPLAMERMDVTSLRFQDASFDVIFCNHVLEHVPDDVKAMGELLRVLKPGGWSILQTPYDAERAVTDEDASVVDRSERIRRFGQEDHVRMYGRDLFDRLRLAGWLIDIFDVESHLGRDAVRRYAITPGQGLIVGRRPDGATYPGPPPEWSGPGS